MAGDTLVFFANGRKVEENRPMPNVTLAKYLREKLWLCGTKLCCEQGTCGVCTVMVSRYYPATGKIRHYTVNSCLTPVVAMHGLAVTTVEGIGSTKTKLHPVQERLAKANGIQCGFCSPGFVMSMYTLLRNNSEPTLQQIESALQGNLCRCTGYRSILNGFSSFAQDCKSNDDGDNCCYITTSDECKKMTISTGFNPEGCMPYEPTQDIIFPSELQIGWKGYSRHVTFVGGNVTWHRPMDINEAFDLKRQYPSAVWSAGSTAICQLLRKNTQLLNVISLTHIEDLQTIKDSGKEIEIGSSVTLSTLYKHLEDISTKNYNHSGGCRLLGINSFLDMLHQVGGHQLRNVASVGSTIVNADGQSDMCAFLLCAGAKVQIASSRDTTTVVRPIAELLRETGKCRIRQEELIIGVSVPYMSENEYMYWKKISEKRDMDQTAIGCALKIKLCRNKPVVDDLTMAFSGISDSYVYLNGGQFGDMMQSHVDATAADKACSAIDSYLATSEAELEPGFKLNLMKTAVRRFLSLLQVDVITPKSDTKNDDIWIDKTPRTEHYAFGRRLYETLEHDIGRRITQPAMHRSGFEQATGEAVYVNDIPPYANELHVALCLSKKKHAKIVSIDPGKALGLEGVIAFYGPRDFKAISRFKSEIWFENPPAVDEVEYEGQVIGAILATDQMIARNATEYVNITYEDLPVIGNIKESVAAGQYLLVKDGLCEQGDIEKATAEAIHMIEGDAYFGGQEHYYMETQSCIVVPSGEHSELTIHSSCQALSWIQAGVSMVLGIDSNKVKCVATRLGGGFGGKQGAPVMFAIIAAIIAKQQNRPVRLVLEQSTDINMTSKRTSVYAKYKLASGKDGKLNGLDVDIFLESGITVTPLNFEIMSNTATALLQLSGYTFPNARCRIFACTLNVSNRCPMRGFVYVPAYLIAQTIMWDVSSKLNLPLIQVQQINLIQGNESRNSQRLLSDVEAMKNCWNICSKLYSERRSLLEQKNCGHDPIKWGLSICPILSSVGVFRDFFWQGAAMVNIFTDGSVEINHGGVEMGQGLHTKLIQVAAECLDISYDLIHIRETSTQCVPNTVLTSASHGTDMYGMAVKDACLKLMERISPYKDSMPSTTWKDWVVAAHFDRTSLSATGFFRPGASSSELYLPYFIPGAAVIEVEIDTETGAHQVLQVDIVMDLGRSLNPVIDIGQIEGAFLQGYGLVGLERLPSESDEALQYKIPGCRDIPSKFNVTVLSSHAEHSFLYGSKAIGEPPLYAGLSVLTAIKDAIREARRAKGIKEPFQIDSPVTPEQIYRLCNSMEEQ